MKNITRIINKSNMFIGFFISLLKTQVNNDKKDSNMKNGINMLLKSSVKPQ
ncbi:MAG: hypothetical protein MJZ34_11275 [Paludibacteraceae bacterium]|nr:hypothetical protein [Paludibacteraceae bacterium]